MTDQDIIDKVVARYSKSGLCFVWGDTGSPIDYIARVLVRYTRWIERAKYEAEVRDRIIQKRKWLQSKREKQAEAKPDDIKSQIIFDAKLRATQELLNEVIISRLNEDNSND